MRCFIYDSVLITLVYLLIQMPLTPGESNSFSIGLFVAICQPSQRFQPTIPRSATESGNIADSSFTVNWEGCNIGTGSTYSFIAFCCFFLGGCWLCLSPKHDPLFCQKDDEAGATEEKPQEEAASPDVETPAADPSSPPAEEEKPSAQVY